MTCKQCKYIDRCMSEASFLGQVFDPDYDGEHSCREFDTFTNADRIRAMSDDLLATQLAQVVKEIIKALTKLDLPDEILNEIRSNFLEKLKQPAEGE